MAYDLTTIVTCIFSILVMLFGLQCYGFLPEILLLDPLVKGVSFGDKKPYLISNLIAEILNK